MFTQTGLGMLCAFPDRYCAISEEPAAEGGGEDGDGDDGGRTLRVEVLGGGSEPGGGTPVYRVPGFEIIIQSDLVRRPAVSGGCAGQRASVA